MFAFGPDSAAALSSYVARERIPFPALSASPEVLRGFGQPWILLQFGRQPALLGVRQGGDVVFTHLGRSPRDLPDIGAALDAVSPH